MRGYRRRDRLKHQLIAECAYAAIYAMRDPQGKTVEQCFPAIFDDDDDDSMPLSDEDIDDLQSLVDNMNSSK